MGTWSLLPLRARVCALVIALLLHQAALCASEGARAYLRQPLHVADALILLAALVLELALPISDDAGLVAVLLGWRLLRVLHGLAATAEAESEDAARAERAEGRVRELERELRERGGSGGGGGAATCSAPSAKD